jgi:hypothetical protein
VLLESDPGFILLESEPEFTLLESEPVFMLYESWLEPVFCGFVVEHEDYSFWAPHKRGSQIRILTKKLILFFTIFGHIYVP